MRKIRFYDYRGVMCGNELSFDPPGDFWEITVATIIPEIDGRPELAIVTSQDGREITIFKISLNDGLHVSLLKV